MFISFLYSLSTFIIVWFHSMYITLQNKNSDKLPLNHCFMKTKFLNCKTKTTFNPCCDISSEDLGNKRNWRNYIVTEKLILIKYFEILFFYSLSLNFDTYDCIILSLSDIKTIYIFISNLIIDLSVTGRCPWYRNLKHITQKQLAVKYIYKLLVYECTEPLLKLPVQRPAMLLFG